MLEDSFETLEVTPGGTLSHDQSHDQSHDPRAELEDDLEESYMEGVSHDPILEPRDPYSLRPLPFRIGTPAFLAEDDVGLGDLPSDSEGGRGTDIYIHVHVPTFSSLSFIVLCSLCSRRG